MFAWKDDDNICLMILEVCDADGIRSVVVVVVRMNDVCIGVKRVFQLYRFVYIV